jgi:hypothetical protein
MLIPSVARLVTSDPGCERSLGLNGPWKALGLTGQLSLGRRRASWTDLIRRGRSCCFRAGTEFPAVSRQLGGARGLAVSSLATGGVGRRSACAVDPFSFPRTCDRPPSRSSSLRGSKEFPFYRRRLDRKRYNSIHQSLSSACDSIVRDLYRTKDIRPKNEMHR